MNISSEIAAIIGIVLGVAGFVLGVINFRRDQARLRVTLLRAEDLQGKISATWPALYVEVANIGRRSDFVKKIGLRARDKRVFHWHELASKEINRSLAEGDAPISESFMLKDLPRFREKSALQAFVLNTKGKRGLSKTLKNSLFPGPKLNKKV